MQKRKNQIKNVLVVLLNIILIISLVLILTKNNDFSYSLYWTVLPFLIVGVLLLVSRWSDLGLNVDKEKSKIIQREFDTITTFSTVFYGLLFLGITFFDVIKENIRNSSYMIIGFFAITLFYELTIFLAIHNAKKQTAKLLEETYNRKA